MSEFNTNNTVPAEDSNLDLKQLLFKYISHWRLFAVSLAVFMALGVYYLLTTAPRYSVTASIMIKETKNIGTNSMLEELDVFSPMKVVENEIEVLRSYTLIEQVVKDLNLGVVYSRSHGLRDEELYKGLPFEIRVVSAAENLGETSLKVTCTSEGGVRIDGKEYAVGEPFSFDGNMLLLQVNDSLMSRWDKSGQVDVRFENTASVVERIRSSLEVKPSGKGTSVLVLSMLSPTPAKGEQILNHLLRVYDRASIADKNNMAGLTLEFIDGRLEIIANDLRELEHSLENYKTANGIANLTAEAQLFLESLQANDADLMRVNTQLGVLDDIFKHVGQSARGTALSTLGLDDPTLVAMVGELTAAEADYAAALQTMKPANPIAMAIEVRIRQLKEKILYGTEVLRTSLQKMRTGLMAENRRLEKIVQAVPHKERELLDMTRQQEIKSQQYLYMLSKREETAISYAATVSDSRLIDMARTSALPVAPIKRNVILVFVLLGLIFPVIVVFLKDLFDTKVETKDEIERRSGLPIVGEIPHLKTATKIINIARHNGHEAEQIRTLRTNLTFMLTGNGPHTILVTSSISGEGKSILSANIGSACAALGKRTVVLGFDLRKPGLYKVFGANNDKGLSDYLTGQATLDQIIQPAGPMKGLDMISAGYMAPNPQELMHGPALNALFDELRKRYDYIVMDSAPIGIVSDAKILALQADVTLYIVRQKFTPKDRLKFVAELNASGQLRNAGIVVNDIRTDKWYGYYTSYGMHKYYGKYYGEQQDTDAR